MRKTILFISIFLVFGCTKIDKNNLDYEQHVNSIFEKKNKFVNKTSTGFKYYLPKGVVIKKDNNNNIILSCDNTNIYFFIDVINYYYKKKISVVDKNHYNYYKEIKDNGYLIVDENNGQYLIKISYNNSIIEFYSTKDKIPELLTISSIILNSVEFNDRVIEKELKEGYNNNGDKTYEIEELERTDSKFSQYLNSFEEEKEENKLPD